MMDTPLDPRIAAAVTRARAQWKKASAAWATNRARHEEELEDLPSLARELDEHLMHQRWNEACAISETLAEAAQTSSEAGCWVSYAEEAAEAANTALAVLHG